MIFHIFIYMKGFFLLKLIPGILIHFNISLSAKECVCRHEKGEKSRLIWDLFNPVLFTGEIQTHCQHCLHHHILELDEGDGSASTNQWNRRYCMGSSDRWDDRNCSQWSTAWANSKGKREAVRGRFFFFVYEQVKHENKGLETMIKTYWDKGNSADVSGIKAKWA